MKLTITTEFGWETGLIGFLKSVSETSTAYDVNVTVVDKNEVDLIYENQLTDEGILYLVHNNLWNAMNEMRNSLDRIQANCNLF